MSECILLKSGGTDLDFITATAADVVAPKVIINKDGEPVTGTMPNNGAIRATLNCGQSKAIPVGYTTGGTVTVNSLASHTSGTAVANNILSGKTAWVNGSKISGTIPSKGATTITPGTSNQTAISAGTYASGAITVAGNSNLVAGNIRKGVTIFGVTGTFSGIATSPYVFLKYGNSINNPPVDATGGATAIKKFLSWNTSGGKASGSYINAYYIGVNNNVYGDTGTASIRFNNAVDLSSYRYLKCNVIKSGLSTGTVSYILGISTSTSATSYSRHTSISVDDGTLVLDVTNLSGPYFVYVEATGTLSRIESGGTKIIYITNITLSDV